MIHFDIAPNTKKRGGRGGTHAAADGDEEKGGGGGGKQEEIERHADACAGTHAHTHTHPHVVMLRASHKGGGDMLRECLQRAFRTLAVWLHPHDGMLRCVAVCCGVLQCVAVCCSELQFVACVAVCCAEHGCRVAASA